jgi:hypothetical protein
MYQRIFFVSLRLALLSRRVVREQEIPDRGFYIEFQLLHSLILLQSGISIQPVGFVIDAAIRKTLNPFP